MLEIAFGDNHTILLKLAMHDLSALPTRHGRFPTDQLHGMVVGSSVTEHRPIDAGCGPARGSSVPGNGGGIQAGLALSKTVVSDGVRLEAG
jgi:hypothetical protein